MSPRWQPLPGDVPEPRKVGESLDRVASSLGVPSASALSGVFASWAELVGEAIAGHSRPVSLRDGTLVVAVDEPAWATQLRWLETELLDRLGEALGADHVTRIDVRVRPRPVPGSRELS